MRKYFDEDEIARLCNFERKFTGLKGRSKVEIEDALWTDIERVKAYPSNPNSSAWRMQLAYINRLQDFITILSLKTPSTQRDGGTIHTYRALLTDLVERGEMPAESLNILDNL